MGNWRVILNFLLIHHPCSQTGFQIFHRNNFSWHKKKAPKDSSVTPQCGMLKQTKIYIYFFPFMRRQACDCGQKLYTSTQIFLVIFFGLHPPPPKKQTCRVGLVLSLQTQCHGSKHFAVQRHWNIEVKKKKMLAYQSSNWQMGIVACIDCTVALSQCEVMINMCRGIERWRQNQSPNLTG